ncbi:MAG TPA: hypothetical protein VJ783_23430 [Pirellulales bacterium]|nr:hypothetical protein [Pirellulales bacterium]
MLKSTRAIIAGLRGGRRPRDAALAVVLGLLSGMLCGWNLSVGLVLIAAIFLNIPTRLFVVAGLVGGAGAWLAADFIRSLGVTLLDRTGLNHAIAALGDGPVVAMLGWDCYALIGGAALALAVSVPAACLAATIAARRNRQSGTAVSPLLRPYGVPVGLVVALGCGAAPWCFGPRMISDELFRQFTEYNTAEVSAAEVRLSLWTGRFTVRDLRIADPANLDRDRLRIGRLIGQLSPGELIRGRLHIDKVSLEHLRADVARRELARSSDEPPLEIEADSLDEPAPPDERQTDIASYLHDWPVVRHDLTWLQWLASAVERLADTEGDGIQSNSSRPTGRSDLGTRRPRVSIEQLSASDLASNWRLGRKALIELSDLSSDPRTSRQPPRLRLVAPRLAGELSLEFQLRSPQRRHAIKCSAYDLDLAQQFDATRAGRAPNVKHATTNLTGEGWMDRRRLELPLQIETQPHDLPIDGPGQFAGIDNSLWRQSLSRLDRLRIEAVLGGSWAAPTLTIDSDRLLAQLKDQLRASGAHDLVRAIDEQLDRPDDTGGVMQASASECELASPGVCQVSDDEAQPRAVAESESPDYRASQTSDTAFPPAYPDTSVPGGQPDEDFAQRQPETGLPQAPPGYPVTNAQPSGRYGHQERAITLPGPVNLFVGLDPIEVTSDRPTELAPANVGPIPPAAQPSWSGDTRDDELLSTAGDAESPRTTVRHSFLARWSNVLRDRFSRSSRVPEPEPIDDLTPPIAPPPFDDPPLGGPLDETSTPTTAAGRPWYQRLWR